MCIYIHIHNTFRYVKNRNIVLYARIQTLYAITQKLIPRDSFLGRSLHMKNRQNVSCLSGISPLLGCAKEAEKASCGETVVQKGVHFFSAPLRFALKQLKSLRGQRGNGLPKTPFWMTVSPHDAFSAPLARSELWFQHLFPITSVATLLSKGRSLPRTFCCYCFTFRKGCFFFAYSWGLFAYGPSFLLTVGEP